MPKKSSGGSRKLTRDEYVRLASFRYALRRFLRFSASVAERNGITGQHYQALLALRGARDPERVAINDLARKMLIQHNSAVGLADRLAAQGLVVRRPLTGDARKVHLELTAKGVRLVERVARSHRPELERVATQISILLEQIASDPRPGAQAAPPRRKAG